MARGRVTFSYELCKGCNLCVEYCPVHILEMDKVKTNQKGYHIINVVEPDKCIGCAFCAMMCPDSVITVER
ncbi:MAG: 4Fe-4S binding protein, partial [Acholeplasmataceae bacterium]